MKNYQSILQRNSYNFVASVSFKLKIHDSIYG